MTDTNESRTKAIEDDDEFIEVSLDLSLEYSTLNLDLHLMKTWAETHTKKLQQPHKNRSITYRFKFYSR